MSKQGYHHITRIGSADAALKLFWDINTGIGSLSDLRVAHYNSSTSTWENLGVSLDSGTVISGWLNTSGSVSSFSPFTIGSTTFNSPLPVQLASFTANINERNVSLNWVTAKEQNNAGFEVQKSAVGSQNSDWVKVGFVTGNGNKSTPTNYSFEDKKLSTGKYNYRLKQIDYNGNFEYFRLSSEIEIGVPKKFDISQNYPNPFNPVTKIDVDLPFDSKIMIKVYDISGREIKTLLNETKQAGYYTVDFNGSSMASGLYFYRIIAEGNGQKYVITKKMVLIK